VRELTVRNRHPAIGVNVVWLRRLTRCLLEELLGQRAYVLGLNLVDTAEITALNETYLRHVGTTDVLAFDYRAGPPAAGLHGEVFVCLDEARRQARRFRVSWQRELVRYVAHGVLHLVGYDDACAAPRRRMKREEDQLLRQLALRFPLEQLGRMER
jgi:rRNA maturation RNase YbeY